MLLHGAPLSNPDQREKFSLKTRFRVVARDVGDYGTGEAVIETEEMVVESSTLTFEDYLEIRVFHLLLTIFYYEGNLEEAFAFAGERGIRPFDLMRRLHHMLDRASVAFRNVIDNFVRESKEELFETRDDVVKRARKRLPDLISGDLGGNLLSKYSMLGRFYVTHAGLDFLEMAIREALGGARSDDGEQLAAVMDYLHSILLHVPFRRTLQRTSSFTARYDVDAWRAAGYAFPLSSYRTAAPLTYRAEPDPEKAPVILNRIETFGEHAAGLGKFTRTMFAKDLRRKLQRLEAAGR